VLLHVDPIRELPERDVWERGLDRAAGVIAFADFLTPALERHATVVFPADAYAEKEGTLTHPDGRLQRVRQAIARPAEVRPGWAVLAELCERAGAGVDAGGAAAATAAMTAAVGIYAGITLEEIGGRGVRWQERDAASALPAAEPSAEPLAEPRSLPDGLRLGIARSPWAGPETEHSPVLSFLAPEQLAELSPADAERIGIGDGDRVRVAAGDAAIHARARVRASVLPGSVFLTAGVDGDNATALMNGRPRTVEVQPA
jgi:NADH-quinone oxidoreductase subunit G